MLVRRSQNYLRSEMSRNNLEARIVAKRVHEWVDVQQQWAVSSELWAVGRKQQSAIGIQHSEPYLCRLYSPARHRDLNFGFEEQSSSLNSQFEIT